MRDCGDHYDYIGVYVDDLEIASKEANKIIEELEITHKFKLKGTGPMTYHLGCDFSRDEDGTLGMSPKKYLERVFDNYEKIYGEKPKGAASPLVHGDHPELDDSDLLEQDGIKEYQSLIGSLQWSVSLGRFDVTTAVMMMSSFHALPRKGHLDRAKRIIGYLWKMKHGTIRFRTEEPDYSDLRMSEETWKNTSYGEVRE